jgi:hypothetical protein
MVDATVIAREPALNTVAAVLISGNTQAVLAGERTVLPR